MNLVDIINQVVGSVPPGWEFVPYVLASACFVVGLCLFAMVLSLPIKFIKGVLK